MTDKELKYLLQNMEQPSIDRKRKEQTMKLVLKSVGNLRGVPRISHWKRLCTMAGYLPWWFWAVQAAVLLLCGFAAAMNGESLLEVASWALPFIGCLGCQEIQKGFSCNMWELEQSCRYNLREVQLLKMQVTGITDVIILVAIMGMCVGRGITLTGCMLTLAVPFLLSAAAYFWLMHKAGRKVSNYTAWGLGILAAFCSAGTSIVIRDFLIWRNQKEALWMWCIGLAAVAVLLLSLRYYLQGCDREEKKTWNFE